MVWRRLLGLAFVALIIGTALAIRIFGTFADGSLAQSVHLLVAETAMLGLSLAAYVGERLVPDNSASRRA